jgi:mRNA interferase MazF
VVIKRGDIFYADLRPVVGSEQGGIRPVLIIQNDTGNKHSPTVICAAITRCIKANCRRMLNSILPDTIW